MRPNPHYGATSPPAPDWRMPRRWGGACGVAIVKIGVTGPLVLNAAQRDAVTRAVGRLITDARWPSHVERWTLCSGMAAGADLLLVEALSATLRREGAAATVNAWLAKPAEQMRADWLRRAAQLGSRPSPEAQDGVDALRARQLIAAHAELLEAAEGLDPYRVLAARLALEPEVLIAVAKTSQSSAPGGTVEVLQWRRQPQLIPEPLNRRYAQSARRALAIIDPDSGLYRLESFSTLAADSDLTHRVRRRLAAGTALAANDLAAQALERGETQAELRYLYLLTLAACGNPRRALERYEELAPEVEQRSEDWLALRARLHKDLAFAGVVADDNLRSAAAEYESAFQRTDGAFSAINAATLALLCGRHADAEALARAALVRSADAGDERARYYAAATRAEAQAVLGDAQACAGELRTADALLRNDLGTRSRTRGQIRRVLRARHLDPAVADALTLPEVYLLDGAGIQQWPTAFPEHVQRRLEGSPVFALEPADPEELSALERLLGCGARLHLLLRDQAEAVLAYWRETWGHTPSLRLRALIDEVEQVSSMGGFLPVEAAWRDRQSLRQIHGLAALQARRLEMPIQRLGVQSQPPRWQIDPAPKAPRVRPLETRRMVGLVFSDMVRFSTFSDAEIRVFWTEIMPRLAATIAHFDTAVLLRQTWGDALHIVTEDARTAAQLSLALVETVRALREGYSGRLGELEIRVGAHYAAAYVGYDAVQDEPTYYGTQLSFTARVEPVTPPGSVFVTEAFSAELQLEEPGAFRLEYAGEVALAKRYGRFRLYSLVAAAH